MSTSKIFTVQTDDNNKQINTIILPQTTQDSNKKPLIKFSLHKIKDYGFYPFSFQGKLKNTKPVKYHLVTDRYQTHKKGITEQASAIYLSVPEGTLPSRRQNRSFEGCHLQENSRIFLCILALPDKDSFNKTFNQVSLKQNICLSAERCISLVTVNTYIC